MLLLMIKNLATNNITFGLGTVNANSTASFVETSNNVPVDIQTAESHQSIELTVRSADLFLYNASSDANPFTLVDNGDYMLTVIAGSWGTVALQRLAADNQTFCPIYLANNALDISANTSLVTKLAAGEYNLHLAGAFGVYAELIHIEPDQQ